MKKDEKENKKHSSEKLVGKVTDHVIIRVKDSKKVILNTRG